MATKTSAEVTLAAQFVSEVPAFDEPWQAQAFALTVALNEAGHLSWPEWAQYFSVALEQAGLKPAGDQPFSDGSEKVQSQHDKQGNARYYLAWLSALEALVRERQWVLPLQLGARREAIRAYSGVAPAASLFRAK